MPERRLARARGECRCPEGVCLYRSGNQPGYCRQDAIRIRGEERCPNCGITASDAAILRRQHEKRDAKRGSHP